MRTFIISFFCSTNTPTTQSYSNNQWLIFIFHSWKRAVFNELFTGEFKSRLRCIDAEKTFNRKTRPWADTFLPFLVIRCWCVCRRNKWRIWQQEKMQLVYDSSVCFTRRQQTTLINNQILTQPFCLYYVYLCIVVASVSHNHHQLLNISSQRATSSFHLAH